MSKDTARNNSIKDLGYTHPACRKVADKYETYYAFRARVEEYATVSQSMWHPGFKDVVFLKDVRPIGQSSDLLSIPTDCSVASAQFKRLGIKPGEEVYFAAVIQEGYRGGCSLKYPTHVQRVSKEGL